MRKIDFYAILAGVLLCLSVSAQTAKTTGTDASEAVVKALVIKNSNALGLTANEARTLRVSSSYYDETSQSIMAYLQQTYKGIDVYNAITVVSFKDNRVVSVESSTVAGIDKLVSVKNILPKINAVEALRKAAADVKEQLDEKIISKVKKSVDGQEFEFTREDANSILVRLMWVPADDETEATKYTLGWQVSLHSDVNNALWLIKIDAQTGRLIKKDNLTVSCNFTTPMHLHTMECYEQPATTAADGTLETEAVGSAKYKVIPYPKMDPNFSAPVLVTNPWTMFANANAYSLKWNSDAAKDYDSTRGNNVYAQPDLDAKDATLKNAARSSTALPNLTFNFTPNYNVDPLASVPNRNFAVTNLFYWNNIMHDMSYQYGFTEAAGNFQQSNQGRGGKQADYVIADAQDASGTNNANFATPVDGSKPRMQMYLWSGSPFKTFAVNSPAAFAGGKMAYESGFSTANKIKDKGPITAGVIVYKDAGKTTSLGCGTPSNAAALKGKIAYIDRGDCDFVTKAKNAQNAGAIAVIIGDNVDGDAPILMGGTDNTITIPAFSILKRVADSIKSYRNANIAVNVTLKSAPQMDGDLDNGVIAHEYTHGISNRLTGGPNNSSCLGNREPRGMGEGWSDFFALMVTTDWSTANVNDGFNKPRPVGNYASGLTPNYGGIRYYPYSTDFNVNPWTYDSLAKSSRITNWSVLQPAPHTVGEVWCSMLWTLAWDIIKQDGINAAITDASKQGGNIVALKLVMQGMKLQKCNPGFVDARDGILKADTLLYSGAYSNIIWKAFAKRGLGYSAKQNQTNNVKDGVAAYNLPPGVNRIIAINSFDAQKQNETAQLKWTTNSAAPNEKYIVERSTDGQAFTAIGSVAAAGGNNFTFVDKQPATGNNIYRIHTVNSNSKDNKLSVERTVTFEGLKAITIAPNPVRDYLKITMPRNTKQLQVKVYNNTGSLLFSSSFRGTSTTVDVRNLAAGSYYVHIGGDGINYKEKFIVE